jgi:cytochrome c biogenesis protein CcmG/thiol:disulfide interchange protein DsbE
LLDRLAQSLRLWAFTMSLVALLGLAWTALSTVPDMTAYTLPPSPKEGFPAPPFTLPDRHDMPVTLSDLAGEAIVLNLWASWCSPCRFEMPALERIHREIVSRDALVMAVNVTRQDSRLNALAFADGLSLSFPILFDDTGEVSRRYQLRALPSTYLIGRDGIIRRVFIGGPLPEATLRASLDPLLRED